MTLLRRYAQFVSRHPYIVMLLVAVISVVCMAVAMLWFPIPDFTDPREGFETRHTDLSSRMIAWTNIVASIGHANLLVVDPFQDKHSPYFRSPGTDGTTFEDGVEPNDADDDPSSDEDIWVPTRQSVGQWFCGPLQSVYGRVVFSPVSPSNSLFHLPSVLSMCHLERRHFRDQPEFSDICQRRLGSNDCCRSWSLPNYLALLNNRSSCADVQEHDVTNLLRLLARCSRFYRDGRLRQGCDDDPTLCVDVPRQCTRHDAVFNLMHFILDRDFRPVDPGITADTPVLSHVASFLPLAHGGALLSYLSSIDTPVRDNVSTVDGLGFDLKGALFDQFLMSDSVYLLAACLLIFVVMCLYTESLLITVCTLMAVLMSLSLAYFFYTVVFQIVFFPFMNVLSAVIALAVGADDAFILCNIWHCSKRATKGDRSLPRLLSETLMLAAPSMMLTSVTTAAAFFATSISHVTAISCFSVFAGLTIVFNMVLMLSWVCAAVVVSQQCWSPCRRTSDSHDDSRSAVLPAHLTSGSWRRCGRRLFEHWLLNIVVRLRWFWLVSLASVAVVSLVIVTCWPGLKLPDSQQFRLLKSSHPVERYDQLLSQRFNFEKIGDFGVDPASSQQQLDEAYYLVMSFVWGVVAVDNGDPLNPDDRGHLKLDTSFNLSDTASQVWMYNFCRRVRAQPFFRFTYGLQLASCVIETMRDWMEKRACVNAVDGSSQWPCCEQFSFPYPPAVFERCLKEVTHSVMRTPSAYTSSSHAGALFLRGNKSDLAVVIVEYNSKQRYTLAHQPMASFVRRVDDWLQEELVTAPEGLKGGWLLTDVEMLDLQTHLASGTLQSAGVAVLLTVVLLLVVTAGDILLSVLATVSVSAVICVSVASLVLMGWRLNVLESAAVTIAVGLSVDYTLHLCTAYRLYQPQQNACCSGALSACSERVCRVRHALFSVGGPVSMAALTSAAAGVCMMPSVVLAYVQMGVFLLVLSTVSWCYSSLFFLSLLCICGPQTGGPCTHRCNRYLRRSGLSRRVDMRQSAVYRVQQQSTAVTSLGSVPDEENDDAEEAQSSVRYYGSYPDVPSSPIVRLATGRSVRTARRTLVTDC